MNWKAIALLLAVILMLVPAVGHADITGRTAGVQPGTLSTYDHYGSGARSIISILVLRVDNSTVIFNYTETFSNSRTSALLWTNVDGSIYTSQYCDQYGRCYTTTDTTKVGTLHYFIGAGLWGGPEYKGSAAQLTKSFFGKIVLGNPRATNYFSYDAGVYHSYLEWDYGTGILTKLGVDLNGAGDQIMLRTTNAWQTHIPIWDTVYVVEVVGGAILAITAPALGYFTAMYIFTFIVVGLNDYVRIKKARQLKFGFPPWLKMIIIASLISAMIFIFLLFFVLPFIVGLFTPH